MKSNLFRLFALLIVISMMASPAAAQSSQVVGPVDDAIVADASSPAAENSVYGVSETGLYIVRLSDPSLAVYDGGIAGLEATSTSVTGARKLDTKAPASVAYLGYLEAQQANFIQSMNQVLGRTVEVQFQYRNVLNGLAVAISHEEAQQIAALPGVTAVYADTVRELDTDVGPVLIGGQAIWGGDTITGLASEGEGVIIGVIDTGINSDHPSFADLGGDGYDHDNPYDPDEFKGWCVANPTFCNDKLIGAYGLNPVDGDPEDTNGHGSHTASTAGGNRHEAEIPDSGGITVTIQGVAPHANIIAYKVCNPGCPESASVMAVDYAIDDLVDVLNYSISGSDDPWNDPVDLAFLEATDAGIFVSASAGNAGPGPAVAKTGPWNAAVAASTHGREIANTLDVTAPAPVPTELLGLLALADGETVISADITADIRYDPNNLDGCNAFDPGYFSGAIALIQRGTCNFTDKVANAGDAGAVAAIIFNNRLGALVYMAAEPTNIDALFMSESDGLALMQYIDDSAPTPVTVRINDEITVKSNPDGTDIVASFSSRGFSVNEILKPDYTAPGVNILAATADPYGDYELMQGTSMSSPHGAGAAALMVGLHPLWSPAQIKSAIASTADNIDMYADDGASVNPATPQDMGSGRIDLAVAAMAGLVFDETYDNYLAADPDLGGVPRDLNQPSLVNYQCAGVCTWTRTVENVLSFAATYTASFTSTVPTLTVTIDPPVFTLNSGETQVLTITANTVGLPVGEYIYGDVLLETDAEIAAGSKLVNAVLLEETFTDATFPPVDWEAFDADGVGTYWITSTTENTGDGGYSAYHSYSSAAYQDGWLVTPPITITADALATLTFWEYETFMDWYAGHYIYACDMADDCSTPPTNYYTVTEVVPADSYVWEEVTVNLSGYAGSSIRVAFVYTGDDADAWRIDDVAINESLDKLPVSDQHLTVVVVPSSAALPDMVDVYTNWRSGMTDVTDLASAEEITDLQVSVDGLVLAPPPEEEEIPQDPTNSLPYNGDGGTMVRLLDVPANSPMLWVEVIASEAPDVDLYVGTGDTPSAATEVCFSAGGSWTEVCEIPDPAAGTWWVLVHSYTGSADQPDLIQVVTAVFDAFGDQGNMSITGPTAVPAGQPFDVTLEWNEPALMDGEFWIGSFTLGTDAANPDNIGNVAVRLEYEAPVTVSKMAPEMAAIGDTIQYNIVVTDLMGSLHGMSWLTDTIPTGLDIITTSITATYGSAWYDETDNAVYWSPGGGTTVAQGPVPQNNPSQGQIVALSLEDAGTTNATTASVTAPDDAVELVLDDGSRENGLGLGGSWEMFFMNRFTPDPSVFPFELNQIQVYFASADFVNVGDDIVLAVYENTTGNADPAVGSNLLATFPTTVQAVDAWNVYDLATPVTLNGPGDVMIGVVALELPGTSYYPAAMDETASQQRSWAGWWASSPPPASPTLPPDDTWGLVDNFGFPANWMIRGYGEYFPPPASVTITFDVVVNDYGLFENVAELWYDGDLFYAEAETWVPNPAIELVKTVGVGPECATTDAITVPVGTEVTYCYTVINTGDLLLTHHSLMDDMLGELLVDVPYDLAPGASFVFTTTAVITENVTNTATWTAVHADTILNATDSATVTVYELDFYIYLPTLMRLH